MKYKVHWLIDGLVEIDANDVDTAESVIKNKIESFIKNNAQTRINSNNYLKLVSKRADWIKEQSDNKLIPLNFSIYKDYVENNKKKNKLFESLSEYSNNLNFKLLKSEKDFIMSNKDLLSNRNRWHKNLKKDIFVSEGVNILEQIFLNKAKSEMILANKE